MRLAIFDVDGTLVDSRSMIVAAMTRAFTDVGIAAPDQDRMLSIVRALAGGCHGGLDAGGAGCDPSAAGRGLQAGLLGPPPVGRSSRGAFSRARGTCWRTCGEGAWCWASPPASRAAASTTSSPAMASRTGSRPCRRRTRTLQAAPLDDRRRVPRPAAKLTPP